MGMPDPLLPTALLWNRIGLCAPGEAAARGYPRVECWVLDWNAPALDFYRSLGAFSMDEWTVYRLTGDALTTLAYNP